jgi:signal transduction histidine kinase/ActR/RegA family two-component response regulator
MSIYNRVRYVKYRILALSCIVLTLAASVYLIPNAIPPAAEQYSSLFAVIIIALLIVLFSYLYLRQKLKFVSHLSAEIEHIKSIASRQTHQLKTAQHELKEQTSLLNILQQANLDFVEHSQLQRTAQFMLSKLMQLTNSECGFIGEVLKQQNGETKINVLSICRREKNNAYTTTDNTDNAAHNDNLINDVLESSQALIKNSCLDNSEQASTTFCCSNISNTIIVPVIYATEIVGVYGLADCASAYDEKLIDFLQPFNATYAVLAHANRSYREQAIIQESLLLAKLEADKASYAKSEFLSRMSHELRTPLNVILGYSQLLLDEVQYKLEADTAYCVSKVEQSGQHLLKLINEVLDLSHVESGLLNMELKSVELNQVMLESIDMVAFLTTQKKIHISYAKKDFSGINVKSERLRLLQVIVNLLSNAIKYNRDNGKVMITGRSEGNVFVISIEDTGIGIADNKKDKLFVAFDRLGAESSDIEGTGIGLPITKKLVEIMGGQLRLSSQLNKGSVFYVHLNHARAETLFTATQNNNDAIHLESIEQGSHTILYIEDNKDNTTLVEKILCKYPSIHLVTAADGLTGLQLAASIHPDIILLDIQLPDINGFDVLRQLQAKQETAAIPVLGVSANAMPKDIDDALSAGFMNYITKPINIRIFLDVINDVLAAIKERSN